MPDLDEKKKKSFELAGEVTKQLILLASGILTFTVTFAKDDFHDGWSSTSAIFLTGSWLLFAFSIWLGIMTMMSMAGNLERQQSPSIDADGPRFFALLQQILFIAAVFATIGFGIFTAPNHVPAKKTVCCQPK